LDSGRSFRCEWPGGGGDGGEGLRRDRCCRDRGLSWALVHGFGAEEPNGAADNGKRNQQTRQPAKQGSSPGWEHGLSFLFCPRALETCGRAVGGVRRPAPRALIARAFAFGAVVVFFLLAAFVKDPAFPGSEDIALPCGINLYRTLGDSDGQHVARAGTAFA